MIKAIRSGKIFDTADKKPKLFDVLAAAVVLIITVAVLGIVLKDRAALIITVIFEVFFVYVIVRLIIAWKGQLKYNPYSYNTIYYAGFALFTLSVLMTFLTLTFRFVTDAENAGPLLIIHTLMSSAKTYMLLSAPFLLVFSVGLCVSNISLIRHEGRRFVNVLGIILSFLLVGGLVFLLVVDQYASGSQFQVMIHEILVNLFAALYLYFECMLIGTIIAHFVVLKYDPAPEMDYIIVLGCRMKKDGTPTNLLKGRIDRALAFEAKQMAETGKAAKIIVSGGQGADEPVSESACMKNYLLSQGFPEERIIEEDKSTNTFENMGFSKEKILAEKPDAKIAFSTTNYHVFRSGLYARRHKMKAAGLGAPTKWYYWPNAAVREFIGILKEHRGKQAIILGSLLVIHVVLTLLAYR